MPFDKANFQAAEQAHGFKTCQIQPLHTVLADVARIELRANNGKLTESEEQALVQWTLAMDKRGYPPSICAVREAAELLLRKLVALPSASIGKNFAAQLYSQKCMSWDIHLRFS